MSQNIPPQYAGQPLFGQIPVPAISPPLGPDSIPPLPTGAGTPVNTSDFPAGSITDGTVQIDVNSPGSNQGQYADYAVTTNYFEDTGLIGSPVCGPAGTAMDVVRVHGGATYKVVSFLIRRFVDLPQLPSSISTSPNDVLIHRQVSPATVGDMPDGNVVWTVTGKYVYLCRVPPLESDILRCGVSPINGIPISSGDLPPTVWKGSLLGPQLTPVAGAGLSAITF